MSHHDDDRDLLAPADAELVRRIAEVYAPAPMTASRRAAFDAELETRLARDRWRFAPWAAAFVTAGAAALLVMTRLAPTPALPVASLPADASSDEEYVLALAGGSADEFESSLPTDYQAIASLLELQ